MLFHGVEAEILEEILQLAIKNQVSDVIIKTGSVPRMRYGGRLRAISNAEKITDNLMFQFVSKILPKHLEKQFSTDGDVDFSYEVGGSRFRVNLYKERQRFAMVMRLIKTIVPTFSDLHLPQVISTFAQHKRGLVLVTGSTGSGKSTTLASLIDKINEKRSYHIVTIEDPIEYIFTEKKSTFSQREIGIDAVSFPHALRASLRQNPDIILVGELRDSDTTETALKAAETGHLVFSTMHTTNCVSTITRIMSYFPHTQHENIRQILANTLRGTVSQRLIPKVGGGVICAHEVMIATNFVRDIIRTGKTIEEIDSSIQDGREEYGMMSFDQSLYQLFNNKLITKDTALASSTSPNNLELRLRGIG